ncbi:unnamed protein product [Phytomonas sp. EM1]|nr:unnamed protein product [Phytomonas sp. EM1]|eukprot:CCW64874.1 unnamed protein product [Phytomonas sp. isolate EM1]
MNFRDNGRGMEKMLIPPTPPPASFTAGENGKGIPSPPFYGSSLLLQFHVLRVMMQMIDDYLEGVLFLDKSLVVRNLRSRRITRQIVGWGLRLTSRTILDTILLSIVTPILLASADHFPNTFSNIRVTPSGILRGLGCGAAGVLLQGVVIPIVSQLVNRGVVTVFEGVEYVLLRRYATFSPDDDDDDDEDENEEEGEGEGEGEEGDAVSSQAGSLRSHPLESDAEGVESKRPAASFPPTSSSHAEPDEVGARQLRRKLRREAREFRRQRRARIARREAAARQAVLRAILYRVSAALVAQCAVEHPLNVLVELLRGRAMMHGGGLLRCYDETTGEDAMGWVGLKRFAWKLFCPAARGEGDGIPHGVWLLRQLGAAIGEEIQVLTACIQTASGQSEAIYRLKRYAIDTIRAGGRPSAWESAELMVRCALSFGPLYYDTQLTALDKLLGFYMAIWTRLTKM